jgi:hypothetical protein
MRKEADTSDALTIQSERKYPYERETRIRGDGSAYPVNDHVNSPPLVTSLIPPFCRGRYPNLAGCPRSSHIRLKCVRGPGGGMRGKRKEPLGRLELPPHPPPGRTSMIAFSAASKSCWERPVKQSFTGWHASTGSVSFKCTFSEAAAHFSGCSHLESLLEEGMNWDNYGEWHIDHRTPRTWFDCERAEDPAFRACWALTNLQPKWGRLNMKKGNR